MLPGDLFAGLDHLAAAERSVQPIGDGAFLIRGAVASWAEQILQDVRAITHQAPGRRPYTPGGRVMAVALSCCGSLGWVSDAKGYRYQPFDPLTGQQWPALPRLWLDLAGQLAEQVGYRHFIPDSCLINRYGVGDGMGLHQDRDEADFSQPIVSFSLGASCIFLWGGGERREKPMRIPLTHGDVFIWGGLSRLRFHGVAPLAQSEHRLTGRCRYNLTFRRAARLVDEEAKI